MLKQNPNGNRRKTVLANATIQTDRWPAWSRQFAARHKRGPLRRPAQHLMLATRRGSLLQRIERCYHLSSRFLSQLNLSIVSDFSTRLKRVHQSIFHGPAQNHTQFQARAKVIAEGVRKVGIPTTRLMILRPNESPAAQRPSEPVETYLRQHLSPSALTKVFTRLEETTSGSSSANFETVLRENHTQLIRRTITERQRHEDLKRGLVSREQKLFALPTKARSIETTVAHATRAAEATPAWNQQTPAMSQVNLERLTDQIVRTIDSRIIAHRERTGQLF